jgi:hypothetical protein
MAMPDEPLRLPWTGEFTPGQLGPEALKETLSLAAANESDRVALVAAIRDRWFLKSAGKRADPKERVEQQTKRAGNVVIGMQRYGLIDRDCRLTELGRDLRDEVDDDRRTEEFVSHVLARCQGLELLDAVRAVSRRTDRVKSVLVTEELRRRGYELTTNSGDPGKLRQWLGTAGVVDDDWRIDEERQAELSGVALATIDEWQGLTRAQRAFLVTLRRLGDVRGQTPVPSPELLDFVRSEHGPIYDESQVKAKIYSRLASDGWIVHTVGRAGRGGKGGLIAATPKLLATDIEALTAFRPGVLPADLRSKLATPLDQIYTELESDDTYTKGIALELLALNLASDLGLMPIALRVRGVRTGGAEVDLVCEGAHLHFSRWLFQCKNTKAVDIGVLAKEIGMATLLQAQVVVIVTTGVFARSVRTYADRISQTTHLQIALVDRDALVAYRAGGALALRERFRRDAHATMRLKRQQVLETLDDMVDDES